MLDLKGEIANNAKVVGNFNTFLKVIWIKMLY